MLTIGLDLVEISRFEHWHSYSDARLGKIFSAAEIAYCKKNPAKSAQRFAVRFAAREALFKALARSSIVPQPPLLTVCHAVGVEVSHTGVTMHVDWPQLAPYYNLPVTPNSVLSIEVSLSHTATTAGAMVLLVAGGTEPI